MLFDNTRWAVERLQRGAGATGDEYRRSAFHH